MGPKRKPPPERPAPNAESVFDEAEVPHIPLQATEISKSMSVNYGFMVKCILDQLVLKSTSENRGRARFLCKSLMVQQNVNHDQGQIPLPEYEYKIIVLPTSGLFVILFRSSGFYETGPDGSIVVDSEGRPKVKVPVRLLFRMRDLYLLGFLYKNKWRLFKDVKIKGLVSGVNINKFITWLPYYSNYGHAGLRVDFERLKFGSPELCFAYSVLSDNENYTQEQTMEALALMSFVCSEGTRRRFLHGRLLSVFSRGVSECVDTPVDEVLKEVSTPSKKDATTKFPKKILVPASKKIRTWSKDAQDVRKNLDGGLDEDARALMRDLLVVPFSVEDEHP
ncbi:unnamed protein product [Urochloa humidicola]